MNKFKYLGLTFVSLVTCYVAFLQFYRLGQLPIVQWDESRLANNAAEMYINQSFLVTTYENQPDLWNTKPPLMIWLQSASIAMFGINEFAIRFPSALSGFLCIIFLGFWMFQISKSYYWSGLTMLLLVVSGGFIQLHGSMTGDYDALLSLFVLLSVYHYSKFYFDTKEKSLLWMIVFVSLAIMAKSAAAFIMFPLFFVLPIFQKKWQIVLKLGLGLLISVLPFIVFCILRENANSGYIKHMWQNDFGGRFNEAIEGHRQPWYYYLENLTFERFNEFIWLFIPGIVWFVFKKNLRMTFISLFILGFILILSIAKTKIHWYDMPILSLISLVIMVFISQVIFIIKKSTFKIAYRVIILAALFPSIISKFNFIVYHENLKLSFDHYELSEYLRAYKGKDKLRYIASEYSPEYFFYTISNRLISKVEINDVQFGEKIVFRKVFEDRFAEVYQYEVLEVFKDVKCVRVIDKKKGYDFQSVYE
jgi:4-amino-4-deoxy-L-arabinose transferase-like glycosyltransferase